MNRVNNPQKISNTQMQNKRWKYRWVVMFMDLKNLKEVLLNGVPLFLVQNKIIYKT